MLNQIFLVSVGGTLALYLFLPAEDKEPFRSYVILYLSLILITSIAAAVTTEVLKVKNNLFIFHIYTPLEYCVISMMFRNSVINPKLRRAITISIPAFLLTSFLFSIAWQTIEHNNSIVSLIEGILVILWSILFLREVLLTQAEEALQRVPMFWVTMGILFYFAGNQMLEGLLNYFMDVSMELARQMYRFSYVFRFILIALLAIGVASKKIFKVSTKS